MTYLIIYDAVRKKAATTPPNILIGNVEMAAGIGMVMGNSALAAQGIGNVTKADHNSSGVAEAIETILQ